MEKNMKAIFHFPFKPYPIQEEFMKELYYTIENKKPGIFESPTGTGKSLSVCCGALQWLKDNNNRTLEALEKEIAQLKEEISDTANSDDWLQEEYEKVKKKQVLHSLLNKLDQIKKQKESLNEMRSRVLKQKANISNKPLEYYFTKDKNKKYVESKENLIEKEVAPDSIEDGDLILEEVEEKEESDEEIIDDKQDEEDETVKIYISSRTHSQLSQFIGEIKKTVFKEDTRVVTLASRQHYCINSDVNRLKNVNLINERCLDLQKSNSKSTSKGEDGQVLKKSKTKSCSACPYYNQANITRLKERMLVDILDMEDLVKCGKELKACPYYASRMALDDAEVVLVSHAGVVSAGARSGVCLKLHDNILILDEAHGLTAALESAHSAPVSLRQLTCVKTFLHFYVNKYRARLSSKNLLALNQMSFVVGKLIGMIKLKTEKQQETKIYTVEDFVIKAEIDHMNLRPLVEFCKNTRLAPKLHGFSMRYSQTELEEEMNKRTVDKKSNFKEFLSNITKKKVENVKEVKQDENKRKENFQPPQPPTESAGSGLYAVVELLSRLCERSANGRVLAASGGDISSLKYLLLNPAEHFSQIVDECRSVIVAGGTMEPIAEFKSLLARDSAVTVVRCEHVVPPHNVLAVCLSKGPTNVPLNFSYENRNSPELLNELSRILSNVCSVVPGGVVCFLPSYSHERTVAQHLAAYNHTVVKKKALFREPKSAADVEQVLQKYAAAVRNPSGEQTGALLLSVVGGKLSEGLNFSDELGRCVLVVGMPYPNVKSAELQEKMSYLNKTAGGAAGNVYYENLCMKAVNQCIGRAVRHANDYACVLLVDERYSRPHTIASLPSFVQKSLISNCNFGPTVANMAKFFTRHKEKK